jgi:branched-chain amino acid transport system substrate-binding protein
MKLRLWTAASVLTLLAGCAGGGGGTANEIVVGEFSSLTGTTATFGQSTHNGIMMAFAEVNAAGGVLGKQLKLITEDDQSKP